MNARYQLSMKCLAVLACLTSHGVHAQVPTTVGYSGRLLNANGSPVTGATQLTFSLYDSASGGTQRWTETQTVLPSAEGLYSVALGEVTVLPGNAFDASGPKYLELSVNGGPPLTPRQTINSVPFALTAANVRGGVVNATTLQVGGVDVFNNGRLNSTFGYQAGPGLTINGTNTVALTNCSVAGQVLVWNGTTWVCGLGGDSSAGDGGVPLVTTPEAPGANCAAGGVQLSNGITVTYVCNGAVGPAGPRGDAGAVGPQGPQGLTGPAPVLSSVGPGSDCATGGVRITSGSATSYVCNGAQGPAGGLGDGGSLGTSASVGARYFGNSGQTISNSNSPIVYSTRDFDTNSAYNTATGEYLVPLPGVYVVSATAGIQAGSGSIDVYRNGTRQFVGSYGPSPNYSVASGVLTLSVGDRVTVRTSSTITLTNNTPAHNNFMIAGVGFGQSGNLVVASNPGAICNSAGPGTLRYNAGALEVCNGIAWVAATAGTSSSGSALVTGFPDAIVCNQSVGLYNQIVLYLTIPSYDSNILYYHAINGIESSSATRYLGFNKVTGAPSQNPNGLNVLADCENLTIPQLVAAGRGKFFGGSRWAGGASNSINYPAGNVGVGTTTPSASLEVYRADGGAQLFLSNDYSVVGRESKIGFGTSALGTYNEITSIIESTNNVGLRFRTTSGGPATVADRLAILGNGNVGVGTTSPGYKLQVAGTFYSETSGPSNNAITGFQNSTTGSAVWGRHTATGSEGYLGQPDFGVRGTAVTSGRWGVYCDVGGGAGCGGGAAWTQVSDARLKKNVETMSGVLDKLTKMRGVYYDWKDPARQAEGRKIGLIAQEVEEVFPELVRATVVPGGDLTGGTKVVSYSELVAPLIEAVKELKAENDSLRSALCEMSPRSKVCRGR
jgi:hypothetical protein